MAEDKDVYKEARDALRETAKWYSASLAALGAALAGGLSFGILPDLGDEYLAVGIAVGLVVFVAILAAIVLVQEILFPKTFHGSRLKERSIKRLLRPYLPTLLPKDLPTLEAVEAKLKIETAQDEIDRLRKITAKVESFAAFLDLQRKIRRTNWTILILFVIACAGIGYLAYLQGIAKKAGGADYVPVAFSPGDGWSALPAALAQACPGKMPLEAEGKADTPFKGWWTIRLKEPQACAGAAFSVPAAVVLPGK